MSIKIFQKTSKNFGYKKKAKRRMPQIKENNAQGKIFCCFKCSCLFPYNDFGIFQ